jgi:glucoamylase
VREQAWLSAAMVQVHEDQTYPGAIVASLSVPWGNTSDSSGGYHLVWTRDAVEASLALVAIGQCDFARRTLAYLVAIQREDGSWSQNCFPDGRAYWTGVQLDEVAFPVLLAAKLEEDHELDALRGVNDMVRNAVSYLVANGPASPQDRWEENSGVSPFTLAIVIAALVAATPFMSEDEARYACALADDWNDRLEAWTYSAHGPLAAQFGVAGHYVRIGPSPRRCGLRGRIAVRNRSGLTLDATRLVGMEYLYLVRLGLRRADDPRITDSLRVSDGVLAVSTPSGVAFHRYNEDGYGEHEDGRAFDGSGIGRAWPLLTGERGHYEVAAGRDPLPYLEAMLRMTGPGGLLPEQVWDAPAIPELGLQPGKPTGSAMPLVWAHAEFLKLAVARERGSAIERLRSVAGRYLGGEPRAIAWHWRSALPFTALPPQRGLVIEADAPFALHCGFDGWAEVRDVASTPLPFGRHAVRFEVDTLSAHASLDFTLRFAADHRWEGVDHRIVLASTAADAEAADALLAPDDAAS